MKIKDKIELQEEKASVPYKTLTLVMGISLLIFLITLTSCDFKTTGMAFGDGICGDDVCDLNETVESCPGDCVTQQEQNDTNQTEQSEEGLSIEEDIGDFKFIDIESFSGCRFDKSDDCNTQRANYNHTPSGIIDSVDINQPVIEFNNTIFIDLIEDWAENNSWDVHEDASNNNNVYYLINPDGMFPTSSRFVWHSQDYIIDIYLHKWNETLYNQTFSDLLEAYLDKYPSELEYEIEEAPEANQTNQTNETQTNETDDEPEPIEFICNEDTICNPSENNTNCPTDCNCNPGDLVSCGIDAGICKKGLQRCNSLGEWTECVGSITPMNETCNDLDDDCDGETDEGFDFDGDGEIEDTELFDLDEDGFFPANRTLYNFVECVQKPLYDCNDTNASINPDAEEVLNGLDDDCDGDTDENITVENKTEVAYEQIDLGILKAEGSEVNLRVGDSTTFKIKEVFGKLEVTSITASKVSFTLYAINALNVVPLKEEEMEPNQVREYDYDMDTKNDVSIQIKSIQSTFKAFFVLKDISNVTSAPKCNNNGTCDEGETEESCALDCEVKVDKCGDGTCDVGEEISEDCPEDCEGKLENETITQESALSACNNDGVCEQGEDASTCPSDCVEKLSGSFFEEVSNILWIVGAILVVITLTAGSIFFVKNNSGPYKVKKDIKQKIVGAIDAGYNTNNMAYYLASLHEDPATIKKSLKYAHDFILLKGAVWNYMSHGHKENEIIKMCQQNKWSGSIVKEVFNDLHKLQKKALNAQKSAANKKEKKL